MSAPGKKKVGGKIFLLPTIWFFNLSLEFIHLNFMDGLLCRQKYL
jgi:hypothetical protein